MGVSRTPLREALNRLSREGLVTLVRHRGYEVTPIRLPDLRDLCEVRLVLESEACALAALRALPEEISELRRLARLPCNPDKPGDRKAFQGCLRNNTSFHAAAARGSHNPRLASLVQSYLEQFQRPLYLELGIGIGSDVANVANAEHLAIVDAIEGRDPALVRRLMNDHITSTVRRILAMAEATLEPKARKRA